MKLRKFRKAYVPATFQIRLSCKKKFTIISLLGGIVETRIDMLF